MTNISNGEARARVHGGESANGWQRTVLGRGVERLVTLRTVGAGPDDILKVVSQVSSQLEECAQFERYAKRGARAPQLRVGRVVEHRLSLGSGQDAFGVALHVVPGDRVITADSENSIRLWQLNKAEGAYQSQEIGRFAVTCLEATPGDRIVVGTALGTVALLTKDPAGRFQKTVAKLSLDSPVLAVRPLPDGRIYALQRSLVSRIDPIFEGAVAAAPYFTDADMVCLDVSPDGTLLLGYNDGTVNLVRGVSSEGLVIQKLHQHQRPVHEVAFLHGDDGCVVSADEREISVVSRDPAVGPMTRRELEGDLVTLQPLQGGGFFLFAGSTGIVWSRIGDGFWTFDEVLYYTSLGVAEGFGQQLLVREAQLLPDGRIAIVGAARDDTGWSLAQIIGGPLLRADETP